MRKPNSRLILAALQNGPLDHWEIAERIGDACWRTTITLRYLVKTGKVECLRKPGRGRGCGGIPGIYAIAK